MTCKISGHFYEPSQGLESVLYKWGTLKPKLQRKSSHLRMYKNLGIWENANKCTLKKDRDELTLLEWWNNVLIIKLTSQTS